MSFVICPQGHELTVEPGRAETACPRCGAVVTLGGREPDELTDVLRMAKARRPRDDDDDDEDDDPPPKKKRGKGDEKEMRVSDRPLPKKKRIARDEEEDEEADDDGAEIKLTRKQRQLSLVRTGLIFHIIKLWIYLAALLLAFVFLPIFLFVAIAGNDTLSLLVRILFGTMVNLAIIVAPLFGVVGSFLCFNVPPKSDARGVILVSLILDALSPITAVMSLLLGLGFLFTTDDRIARLSQYMNMASLACTLVAWWVFMIFLRKLGFYMKETLMASEALNVITHLIVATLIGPVLVVITFAVAVVVGGIFPLIMFVLLVIWLLYFIITFPIRMFRMLFLMRSKIWDKYLKPDDDDDLPSWATGT